MCFFLNDFRIDLTVNNKRTSTQLAMNRYVTCVTLARTGLTQTSYHLSLTMTQNWLQVEQDICMVIFTKDA